MFLIIPLMLISCGTSSTTMRKPDDLNHPINNTTLAPKSVTIASLIEGHFQKTEASFNEMDKKLADKSKGLTDHWEIDRKQREIMDEYNPKLKAAIVSTLDRIKSKISGEEEIDLSVVIYFMNKIYNRELYDSENENSYFKNEIKERNKEDLIAILTTKEVCDILNLSDAKQVEEFLFLLFNHGGFKTSESDQVLNFIEDRISGKLTSLTFNKVTRSESNENLLTLALSLNRNRHNHLRSSLLRFLMNKSNIDDLRPFLTIEDVIDLYPDEDYGEDGKNAEASKLIYDLFNRVFVDKILEEPYLDKDCLIQVFKSNNTRLLTWLLKMRTKKTLYISRHLMQIHPIFISLSGINPKDMSELLVKFFFDNSEYKNDEKNGYLNFLKSLNVELSDGDNKYKVSIYEYIALRRNPFNGYKRMLIDESKKIVYFADPYYCSYLDKNQVLEKTIKEDMDILRDQEMVKKYLKLLLEAKLINEENFQKH